MSPANTQDLQARVAFDAAQREKVRAVERLERALWRWRSERKIHGADDALLSAIRQAKAEVARAK